MFFAVAGHIGLIGILPEWVWPIAELVALAVVLAATVFARRSRLQDRWTACRFGAEQLRIARMCLPLLVTPRALSSTDRLPNPDESQQALDEVKRIVRDQGLPDLPPTMTAVDAARWVRLVVADQAGYRRNNHRKLHCAERRLVGLTVILFGLAVLAVWLHLFGYSGGYLLLFTAALPAFAAALHGVTTRLGFVHRIHLSQEAEKELEPIQDELDALIDRDAIADWSLVHALTTRAAEAMAQENTSWHSQVRRQKDDIV